MDMKKLKGLLALVAIFSVALVPACGGDTQPSDESAPEQMAGQPAVSSQPADPSPTVAPSDTLSVSADLYGVFSVSQRDVFAVGAAGTILHYSGAWSAETSPVNQDLRAVWATSGGQAWAVGLGGTILRRSGSSWSQVPSPTDQDLYGVWASSLDSAWAAGSAGLILHWDGTSWTVAHDRMAGMLRAVWGSGPSDVWVVGSGREPDGDYAALLLHWDGSSWSESYVCNPDGTSHSSGGFVAVLSDVWGTPGGGGTVWGAGRCQSGASFIPYGYVAQNSGAGWTDTPGFGFGLPEGKYRPLQTIWSSSDHDVWAASASETVNGAPTPPTMLHWDGSSWTPSSQNLTVGVNDLGGTAANDVWAVGLAGKRLHFNGTTWIAMP